MRVYRRSSEQRKRSMSFNLPFDRCAESPTGSLKMGMQKIRIGGIRFGVARAIYLY